MGHVTSVHQGLSSARGKSLGTRLSNSGLLHPGYNSLFIPTALSSVIKSDFRTSFPDHGKRMKALGFNVEL
jgi:hypothetical protein